MNDYRLYRDLVRLQRAPGPYLAHYGVSKADGAKRGSGRYPLGSGERPNQHDDERVGETEKKESGKAQATKNGGGSGRGTRRSSTKAKQLEQELEFLEKEYNKSARDTSEDYGDRFEKFRSKIENESVDWYEDIPKSKGAKKLYAESKAKREEIENTLGEKYREERDKWRKVENKIAWRGGIKFSKEKVMERSFKEVEKAYNDARREWQQNHNRKLVDVVLKDLGIPVTDANRKRIYYSGVLFWD